MYQERKKLGFEILLGKLRSNLGRLILVNLIFAIPLLFSMGIASIIYLFVFRNFPLVLPLAIILASPFYAGVVALSRDISRDIMSEHLVSDFFKAVKENGLRFLVWGIVMYLGFEGCYFGFTVYSSMARHISWIFYVVLFFVFIISLFFLFISYLVPLMTVSFELKQKDIYKNSALMTFGEIKNNFFSTFSVIIFLAVVLMPFIIISYLSALLPVNTVKILLIAYLVFAFGVLIPAPCSMMISHYLYPNMHTMIVQDDADKGISSVPSDVTKTFVAENSSNEESDVPEFDIEELREGDGDEYIFYHGKMIKRKLLLKILEQKEEENEDE